MRPPVAPTVLAALLLAGCRAFPVGLYVPDEVLDALARPAFEERIDERALARELAARAGAPVRPVHTAEGRYWRLAPGAVRGPLAPEELARCGDPAAEDLASGDLVLVKNGRAQSLATTLTFGAFTFYDHMGVLVAREGRWLVCDSWPRFRPFVTAEDFADRFRGGVRATPLARFLAHYETLLFVRLPDPAAGARLAAAALASLEEGIEYDPHHDPTDARLSCSEYVLLLLARAGIECPVPPRAVLARAELRRVLEALGFARSAFFVPDQVLDLPGARAVAWISRHPTRAGARAVEAAFALLHARFQEGARLADFLAVDRFRFLRYRANVAAFLSWSEGFALARGLEDGALLAEELRALAPLFFRRL